LAAANDRSPVDQFGHLKQWKKLVPGATLTVRGRRFAGAFGIIVVLIPIAALAATLAPED
jgi:hypothetical protein